ncbi:C45 family autoproteolytic acyltransferase/hydolase [Longispora albida]|uniref:C45 family autoproteolytic acyltransferase/hydolase n=1 Tax=Longispora albida TaxID=203523 RepID=UPI00036946C1|nr:C45 family peptidase [Longispora albida]
MSLPLIVANGTPAEIGASYGSQAATLIAGNLEDYRAKFRNLAGLDSAEVTRAGEEFRETTRKFVPRTAETLDAIADAAGIAVGDIYALNARTELMLEGNKVTECTGLAVLPEHTASGHTLLGQNWDWYPTQAPYTILLATQDERGHEILTLAEAGMLAKAGLNSAGVGVCVNLLGSDRDTRSGGVPYHVLIRALLDRPEGISAALTVTALPRSVSINMLIATGGPHGGTALDLELAPGAVGRLYPRDGLLSHANHFSADLPLRDRVVTDYGGSTLFREFRVRQVTADAAADRSVSEKDLVTAFTDHVGFPHSVCRHVNPSDPEELHSLTASSVVMDLDERRLMITDGPPCEREYRTYSLDGIFRPEFVTKP